MLSGETLLYWLKLAKERLEHDPQTLQTMTSSVLLFHILPGMTNLVFSSFFTPNKFPFLW